MLFNRQTMLRLAALPVSLLAVPALADAPPAPAPEQPAAEKQVCRRVTATGSIMSKRVCHTKAEWAQIQSQTSDSASTALDHQRRESIQGTN